MPTRPVESPLAPLIAGNVKRFRKAENASQDAVAIRMQLMGFPWTRAAVAALETGRKEVSIEELIGLAAVFQRPLADFFKTSEQSVELVKGATQINRSGLKRAFQGEIPSPRPYSRDLERHATGELEQNAARQLGVESETIAQIAEDLWQQSLTAERNRRGQQRPKALQHVSRELIQELREIIDNLDPETVKALEERKKR
jgi:transcriptional regulator with XRE-family HTH domain